MVQIQQNVFKYWPGTVDPQVQVTLYVNKCPENITFIYKYTSFLSNHFLFSVQASSLQEANGVDSTDIYNDDEVGDIPTKSIPGSSGNQRKGKSHKARQRKRHKQDGRVFTSKETKLMYGDKHCHIEWAVFSTVCSSI